jgi:ubiquinone/menaquinone biosynthesis C-methylase UbiE
VTTPAPADPAAFRRFEHDGWEKLPQDYHDAFSRLTTQVIPALLDAAGVRRGTALLDVASGPGYVADAAAQRGAQVVGVDFAASMVEAARRRYPALRFEAGDAEALAFAEASFDAVTINFGMLHLGRPDQALAEAHRVLRPGGKVAFTVWAKPDQARGMGMVLEAVQKHGSLSVPLPPGPPFFRFSDAAEAQRSLLAAGFVSPQVATVPQTWRFEAPDELFEVMLRSTVRNGALLRAQTPQALSAIRTAVREAASSFSQAGKIAIPMPAVLSSATKGFS